MLLTALVWLGALPGRGQEADGGIWRMFGPAEGLSTGPALTLSVSPGGSLWVHHGDVGGISVFDGYSVRHLPPVSQDYPTLHESRTGQIWAMDREGLREFRRDGWLTHRLETFRNLSDEAFADTFAEPPVMAAERNNVLVLFPSALLKVDVVLQPGQQTTGDELARFVNDNAPYFFVPRYIEFVDELPHTPTGRVRKFELRKHGVSEQTWDREKAGFIVKR